MTNDTVAARIAESVWHRLGAYRELAVRLGEDKLHFPYTEEELLTEITPEKAHADSVAQPAGPEIGA